MATLTEFREYFPELSGHADDAVERALIVAREMHGLRDKATLYCAAHLIAIDDGIPQPDGGQGEVIAESVGSQASRYMAMAESGRQTFFTTTSYGRVFLELELRSSYSVPIRIY